MFKKKKIILKDFKLIHWKYQVGIVIIFVIFLLYTIVEYFTNTAFVCFFHELHSVTHLFPSLLWLTITNDIYRNYINAIIELNALNYNETALKFPLSSVQRTHYLMINPSISYEQLQVLNKLRLLIITLTGLSYGWNSILD